MIISKVVDSLITFITHQRVLIDHLKNKEIPNSLPRKIEQSNNIQNIDQQVDTTKNSPKNLDRKIGNQKKLTTQNQPSDFNFADDIQIYEDRIKKEKEFEQNVQRVLINLQDDKKSKKIYKENNIQVIIEAKKRIYEEMEQNSKQNLNICHGQILSIQKLDHDFELELPTLLNKFQNQITEKLDLMITDQQRIHQNLKETRFDTDKSKNKLSEANIELFDFFRDKLEFIATRVIDYVSEKQSVKASTSTMTNMTHKILEDRLYSIIPQTNTINTNSSSNKGLFRQKKKLETSLLEIQEELLRANNEKQIISDQNKKLIGRITELELQNKELSQETEELKFTRRKLFKSQLENQETVKELNRIHEENRKKTKQISEIHSEYMQIGKQQEEKISNLHHSFKNKIGVIRDQTSIMIEKTKRDTHNIYKNEKRGVNHIEELSKNDDEISTETFRQKVKKSNKRRRKAKEFANSDFLHKSKISQGPRKSRIINRKSIVQSRREGKNSGQERNSFSVNIHQSWIPDSKQDYNNTDRMMGRNKSTRGSIDISQRNGIRKSMYIKNSQQQTQSKFSGSSQRRNGAYLGSDNHPNFGRKRSKSRIVSSNLQLSQLQESQIKNNSNNLNVPTIKETPILGNRGNSQGHIQQRFSRSYHPSRKNSISQFKNFNENYCDLCSKIKESLNGITHKNFIDFLKEVENKLETINRNNAMNNNYGQLLDSYKFVVSVSNQSIEYHEISESNNLQQKYDKPNSDKICNSRLLRDRIQHQLGQRGSKGMGSTDSLRSQENMNPILIADLTRSSHDYSKNLEYEPIIEAGFDNLSIQKKEGYGYMNISESPLLKRHVLSKRSTAGHEDSTKQSYGEKYGEEDVSSRQWQEFPTSSKRMDQEMINSKRLRTEVKPKVSKILKKSSHRRVFSHPISSRQFDLPKINKYEQGQVLAFVSKSGMSSMNNFHISKKKSSSSKDKNNTIKTELSPQTYLDFRGVDIYQSKKQEKLRINHKSSDMKDIKQVKIVENKISKSKLSMDKKNKELQQQLILEQKLQSIREELNKLDTLNDSYDLENSPINVSNLKRDSSGLDSLITYLFIIHQRNKIEFFSLDRFKMVIFEYLGMIGNSGIAKYSNLKQLYCKLGVILEDTL